MTAGLPAEQCTHPGLASRHPALMRAFAAIAERFVNVLTFYLTIRCYIVRRELQYSGRFFV